MLRSNCRTGLGAMVSLRPECAPSRRACWYSVVTGPCLHEPFLRADFPLNLPHINPHRQGELVSPCLFEGSLNELLHRFGLDAVVDQLIDWLPKAAAGTLLDLEQGGNQRAETAVLRPLYSVPKVAAAAPPDGTILVVPAGYVTIDGGLYAIINAELTAQVDPVFYQDVHNDKLGKWGTAMPRPSSRALR